MGLKTYRLQALPVIWSHWRAMGLCDFGLALVVAPAFAGPARPR